MTSRLIFSSLVRTSSREMTVRVAFWVSGLVILIAAEDAGTTTY